MAFDYKAAMSEGHKYNKVVSMRLKDEGIDSLVPDLEFAQTREEIKDFTANEKDIIVGDHVLEVKSRNLYFTDDPSTFPYDDLIIDTVSGFEGKANKPLAYVMVSQRTGGMFVVPSYTSKDWRVEVKYDRDRKHEDKFYLASKANGRPFATLVKHLKDNI